MQADLVSTLPPAEEIERTAREVVSRSYYKLDSPDEAHSINLFLELIKWIITPFRWLFESMEGLPDVLRWVIVVGLFVILVLLIAHIVYSLVTAIKAGPSQKSSFQSARDKPRDPKEFEREAEDCAQVGDYIGAIRHLFRASLLSIEQSRKRRFQPGFTNRELLRRFKSTPLATSLEWFVDTIDLKWYGGEPCTEADFVASRDEYGQLRNHLREAGNAFGA